MVREREVYAERRVKVVHCVRARSPESVALWGDGGGWRQRDGLG